MNREIIVQVCSSNIGGGAENLVVKLLNDTYKSKKKYGVFFSESNESIILIPSELVFFGQNPRSLLNLFKLRFFFKKILKSSGNKKVIVHVHLTWPLFFVAVATIGLRLTLIYTEHSTFNKRRNYPFFKFIDLFAYSRYSKIIGISRATTSALLSWLGPRYQNKIITIENGAELYKFSLRKNIPTGDKLKLLSVGSLKYLKGFETTIKSLQIVKDLVDSYTIVGIGPELDKLQNLAKDYGVDDIVHFVGWSDNPMRFYQNSDVLLIPSHWEGFGLVAVEGMSTGLPVIASNVSGLNSVVSENLLSSILIDDFKEPSEWSSAIKDIKKKLIFSAKELSLTSRSQAEKFNIDKMLNAYEALYVELSKK